MNKFENKILQFIEDRSLIPPGSRVLVACSGGVDSVALLHFMVAIKIKLEIDVAAVHVDHMLRGTESAEDGEYVKALCSSYGIPFFGGSVPVPAILALDGGNVQDVCRKGRYAYFTTVMEKERFGILAMAHHAEDQLETVLMEVTKGSKPSGMAIRREVAGGHIIRPFLPSMKTELASYLEENDMAFREDPSNASDAYLRNRFRRHVLPFIQKENPSIARNVVKMTERLQEDEDLLGLLAQEHFKKIVTHSKCGNLMLHKDDIHDAHPALQKRIITLVLNYLYNGESIHVEYNAALINQLLHHIHFHNGNVAVDLPRGYQFVREYDLLTFSGPNQDQEIDMKKLLPMGVWTKWGQGIEFYWDKLDNAQLETLTHPDDIMYFDLPDSAFPLGLRTREDGDRILLSGMTHSKRLSRLFIDEKVGMSERDRLPILVTKNGDVCAVPGLRYGSAFSRNRMNGSKYIFSIRRY